MKLYKDLTNEEQEHYECCTICHPSGFSEDEMEEDIPKDRPKWEMYDNYTDEWFKHLKVHNKKELISYIGEHIETIRDGEYE